MKILRTGEIAAEARATPLFTGIVTMQTLVDQGLSQRFLIRQVHFPKGVRNKFHRHTTEQVLIVTSGKGVVATETEERIVVPGDVIFIPAGEKHWHGATARSSFSHLYVMGPDSETTQMEP